MLVIYKKLLYNLSIKKQEANIMHSPRPAYVDICGDFSSNTENHGIHRSGIEDMILIYCYHGEGFIRQRSKTLFLNSGTLGICFPNEEHTYRSLPENPWHIIWAHVRGDVSWFLSAYNERFPEFTVNISSSGFLSDFRALVRSFNRPHSGITSRETDARLQLLLCSILSESAAPSNSGFIEKSLGFIEGNFLRPVTVDEIAAHVNTSKYHFIRRFAKETGMTPHQYILQLKLQEACRLLKFTNLSIAEISRSLGYDNCAYFSGQFKNRFGTSPTAYRKK